MNRVIYACDVGSIRAQKFAWARVVPGKGAPTADGEITALAARLTEDAMAGMSIALGFECPLFMPVPIGSDNLTCGRKGEKNRSMFASVGASVATLGVQEASWILRELHNRVRDILEYSIDWNTWPPQEGSAQLFLWEAFISGDAHAKSDKGDADKRDAATAAVFFRDNEDNLAQVNAVTADLPMCLLHAVALWAGWARDLDRLHKGCLVLKPQSPYQGNITIVP